MDSAPLPASPIERAKILYRYVMDLHYPVFYSQLYPSMKLSKITNHRLGRAYEPATEKSKIFGEMDSEHIETKSEQAEPGILGTLEVVVDSLPKEAGNAHGTFHASAMHTYMEFVGTWAIYCLDSTMSKFGNGLPRTISVGTNLSIDYISSAQAGDRIRIIGKVYKIGKA